MRFGMERSNLDDNIDRSKTIIMVVYFRGTRTTRSPSRNTCARQMDRLEA